MTNLSKTILSIFACHCAAIRIRNPDSIDIEMESAHDAPQHVTPFNVNDTVACQNGHLLQTNGTIDGSTSINAMGQIQHAWEHSGHPVFTVLGRPEGSIGSKKIVFRVTDCMKPGALHSNIGVEPVDEELVEVDEQFLNRLSVIVSRLHQHYFNTQGVAVPEMLKPVLFHVRTAPYDPAVIDGTLVLCNPPAQSFEFQCNVVQNEPEITRAVLKDAFEYGALDQFYTPFNLVSADSLRNLLQGLGIQGFVRVTVAPEVVVPSFARMANQIKSLYNIGEAGVTRWIIHEVGHHMQYEYSHLSINKLLGTDLTVNTIVEENRLAADRQHNRCAMEFDNVSSHENLMTTIDGKYRVGYGTECRARANFHVEKGIDTMAPRVEAAVAEIPALITVAKEYLDKAQKHNGSRKQDVVNGNYSASIWFWEWRAIRNVSADLAMLKDAYANGLRTDGVLQTVRNITGLAYDIYAWNALPREDPALAVFWPSLGAPQLYKVEAKEFVDRLQTAVQQIRGNQ